MLSKKEEGIQLILHKLARVKEPLSILTYTAGILCIILITRDDISPRTYFSENALLPGAVETGFVDVGMAERLNNDFYEKRHRTSNSQFQWIKEEMLKLGLDVYEQHFNASGKQLSGQNLHGILHSQRSAGVEALVLHIPLRESGKRSSGLGLMLAIARYFSEQIYWSKNIIFLITPTNPFGLRAWLSAYHGDNVFGISSSPFEGHAGVIQAALTIDFESLYADQVVAHIEGTNGLLPNLDLVNLVMRIFRTEGLKARLRNELHTSHAYGDLEKLISYSRNLFAMMAVQASGFPSGFHGEYLSYRIEALTIRADGQAGGRTHAFQLGRVIESIFRSLNSLLEQFHQSFFFYILANHVHFISIGLYMIPFGLLLFGPALHAALLWNEMMADSVHKSPTRHKGATVMWTVIAMLSFTHLVAYFTYDRLFNSAKTVAVTVEFCCTSCMVIAVSLRYICSSLPAQVYKAQRLIANLYIILTSLTVGMFNFSLGYFIAAFWAPLCIFPSDAVKFKAWQMVRVLVCGCLSPPAILIDICMLYNVVALGKLADLSSLLNSMKQANDLLAVAVEYQAAGVWVLELTTLVLFPLWTLITVT